MKVSFVLPGFSRKPVGGYKIAFEYANRLARHGYNVELIFINNNSLKRQKLPHTLRKQLLFLATQYEPTWFKLNKKIKKISYLDSSFSQKIKTDVAIATAVETAYPTKRICVANKKYYFIQDFEDWNVSKDYLYSTYRLGFKNIVIAKWLKKIVDKYSLEPSTYIRNPINTMQYKVYKDVDKRDTYTIGMLYHSADYKGSSETLNSICKLKSKFPKLKIIMFGTCNPPVNLPKWIKYYKNASQKRTIEIYNRISIFVSGSIREGFGLTGLESMACGAALVTTNYDGAKEYAINNVNALTVPVKDWNALCDKVEFLLRNNDVRKRLAEQGVKTAQNFSWDNAYQKLVNIIVNDEKE